MYVFYFLIFLTCAGFARAVDYVFVAYDEPPLFLLNHLKMCVTPQDRVFIYLKFGGTRTHDLETKYVSRVLPSVEKWNVTMPYTKYVYSLPNSWCCDEMSGFLYHITTHYGNFQKYTAFLHAHVDSWHSDPTCKIVDEGLKFLETSEFNFYDVNRLYSWRCMSPNGFTGVWTSKKLRDTVYSKWKRWTLDAEPPKRFYYNCCTQAVVKRAAIMRRPFESWSTLMNHSMHQENLHWEYIWSTLLDPHLSERSGFC